jgi:hypothetical protein
LVAVRRVFPDEMTTHDDRMPDAAPPPVMHLREVAETDAAAAAATLRDPDFPGEHHCDFASLLPAVRAVRERLNWDLGFNTFRYTRAARSACRGYS